MSLNKFFDENIGYDVAKFDIGALEMKCDDLQANNINGDTANNGIIEDVNYNPYPATAIFGNLIQGTITTNNQTNIVLGGGSKKSLLTTGNIIIDNPVSLVGRVYFFVNIDYSPYKVKFPINTGLGNQNNNLLCGTASATIRDFNTSTGSTNSYNCSCFVNYEDENDFQNKSQIKIVVIRQFLDISTPNPERKMYVNYTFNLPLQD